MPCEQKVPVPLAPTIGSSLLARLTVGPQVFVEKPNGCRQGRVVEKRRTAGTYVSDLGSPLARRERVRILTQRIDALLAEARQMNIDTDAVVELIRQRDEIMQAQHEEK